MILQIHSAYNLVKGTQLNAARNFQKKAAEILDNHD